MTGDRMINLAKTPGNIDFQSKYYKPDTSSTAAVKSLENRFESVSETDSPPSPAQESTSSHKENKEMGHHQNVSLMKFWFLYKL